MKVTKRPVTVDAMRWDGKNQMELMRWAGEWEGRVEFTFDGDFVYIHTLEGEMRASNGDWIIRGVKGEFYPCKPDIFAETYEIDGDFLKGDFRAATPEESAAIDEAAGLVMISLRVSKELHARLVDGAASAGVVFPAYVRSLLDDREVAIAQAVEFAEYVEQHAKGKMEEAAKRLLSQSFAQEMRERLAHRKKFDTMVAAAHEAEEWMRDCPIQTNQVGAGQKLSPRSIEGMAVYMRLKGALDDLS